MEKLAGLTPEEVREVAASVSDSEQVKQLLRLAQEMDNMQNVYNNTGFDPSQESGVPGQTQDMAFEEPVNEDFDPSQEVGSEAPVTDGSKIPIESFVKVDGKPQAPSNYTEHTCSVLFKAPNDIQESDMMNYILGIGKELGVEVTKFEWEKLPPKETKTR